MGYDYDDIGAETLQRENVLYLVAELEGAIRRGAPLTAEDAKRLPERLIHLAAAIYRRAAN